jgi:hypothetical protein
MPDIAINRNASEVAAKAAPQGESCGLMPIGA